VHKSIISFCPFWHISRSNVITLKKTNLKQHRFDDFTFELFFSLRSVGVVDNVRLFPVFLWKQSEAAGFSYEFVVIYYYKLVVLTACASVHIFLIQTIFSRISRRQPIINDDTGCICVLSI
jgi:hypothetical protein